ncbi:S-methyl-5'-thioinosine phosphorylase [Vogesella indigofera]|uniref:Probable 6-oxopurine nucleoside phosphorylase n=1 Tax=Vogesella indigofera TaxID=45465 RepID=A0ABT5I7F3_VOGIN|nr:S-methyl-5'-thioinosine phosphorylase [Vogesella indigofera]MDC7691962.1 S-methyl-5'-thioinosine phosphorylase [Vogesella indigofera]
MLAIIGGSRLAKLPVLEVTHRQVVRTPYGDPSCALTFGRVGQQSVVFIARHGYGNSIAPHEINYRANIWALHSVGVKGVVAIGSVGGIRPDITPGSLVVPHDLIDYTWGRKHTFFEGADRAIKRVDLSAPYDDRLRLLLLAAAERAGLDVVRDSVYAVTQGPRLETCAEIARLERDGADVVGMTGMPEAALARELGVPYASLCIVTNWASGLGLQDAAANFNSDIIAGSTEQLQRILQAL